MKPRPGNKHVCCQGAVPGTAGKRLSLLWLRGARLQVLCCGSEGRDWMILCFYRLPHAAHTALGEYFCLLHPDPSFLSASRLVHNLVPSIVIKYPVSESSSRYHPNP